MDGPPDQFACPLGLAQPGTDFCLDLQGLDLGRQYSAEVVYQLDSAGGKWSPKGSPLFFILVQDESSEEAAATTGGPLQFHQVRVEQLEGAKSAVHWKAEGPAVDQVRAYQVIIICCFPLCITILIGRSSFWCRASLATGKWICWGRTARPTGIPNGSGQRLVGWQCRSASACRWGRREADGVEQTAGSGKPLRT